MYEKSTHPAPVPRISTRRSHPAAAGTKKIF
jgi:hypothetical protein